MPSHVEIEPEIEYAMKEISFFWDIRQNRQKRHYLILRDYMLRHGKVKIENLDVEKSALILGVTEKTFKKDFETCQKLLPQAKEYIKEYRIKQNQNQIKMLKRSPTENWKQEKK